MYRKDFKNSTRIENEIYRETFAWLDFNCSTVNFKDSPTRNNNVWLLFYYFPASNWSGKFFDLWKLRKLGQILISRKIEDCTLLFSSWHSMRLSKESQITLELKNDETFKCLNVAVAHDWIRVISIALHIHRDGNERKIPSMLENHFGSSEKKKEFTISSSNIHKMKGWKI